MKRVGAARVRALLVVGVLAAVAGGTTAVAAQAPAAEGWTAARRVVAALAPLSTSVAIDADGHLHVAYLEDHDPGGLRYATDRGGWHWETVAADVGFEAHPSIAVAADGHVVIAFARMTCPASPGGVCDDPDDVPVSRIMVASNAGGAWRVRARSAGPADVWPSLAIAGGHLHIAFQRQLWPPGQAAGGTWYLTNAGGWHETQVASDAGRCFADQIPSIAAGPSGRVWIAWSAPRSPAGGCGGSAGIRVATSAAGGAWTRETVTTRRDDVQPVLALDPAGRPGLIFDRAGVGIRFTRRIDGDWRPLTAVSDGAEGSLAFDRDGVAHVAAEGAGGIVVAVGCLRGFTRTRVYAGPVDYGTYGGPGIALLPGSGLARVVFGRSEPDATPLEDELGLYLVRERP